jgi:hypothetical protein
LQARERRLKVVDYDNGQMQSDLNLHFYTCEVYLRLCVFDRRLRFQNPAP